jgi:hypothetical protein
MDALNCYYTYAYLREDGTPYYIGKGKGMRAFCKQRNVKVPPKERILFLKTNLTNEEAIRHEVYMIFVFGRKDKGTGILWNFTDGGEGVPGNDSGIMKAIENNPNHQKDAFASLLMKNPNHQSEAGIKGAKALHEAHPELSSNTMKQTNSVKVQCTITGHISNYGGLAKWQKARGISTINRRVLG